MNAGSAEHVKEAAAVVSQYADIIGIRTFPGLKDREKDYTEQVIEAFKKYAQCADRQFGVGYPPSFAVFSRCDHH